ncbi:MAG: hypothetical protein ACOYJB_07710 [Christensenellaceae bacterium]|jgi:hypothetical protein
MKNVCLKIGDKEFQKMYPMIGDWKNLLQFNETVKGKNMIADTEPMAEVIHVVAEYVGAPEAEIEKHCSLDKILEAFHAIDENIVEAFTGGKDPKNAEGRKRPAKQ